MHWKRASLGCRFWDENSHFKAESFARMQLPECVPCAHLSRRTRQNTFTFSQSNQMLFAFKSFPIRTHLKEMHKDPRLFYGRVLLVSSGQTGVSKVICILVSSLFAWSSRREKTLSCCLEGKLEWGIAGCIIFWLHMSLSWLDIFQFFSDVVFDGLRCWYGWALLSLWTNQEKKNTNVSLLQYPADFKCDVLAGYISTSSRGFWLLRSLFVLYTLAFRWKDTQAWLTSLCVVENSYHVQDIFFPIQQLDCLNLCRVFTGIQQLVCFSLNH